MRGPDVGVCISVGVGTGVTVRVGAGVGVGVGVTIGVAVGVGVGRVTFGVDGAEVVIGVSVGIAVGVGDGLPDGIIPTATRPTMSASTAPTRVAVAVIIPGSVVQKAKKEF